MAGGHRLPGHVWAWAFMLFMVVALTSGQASAQSSSSETDLPVSGAKQRLADKQARELELERVRETVEKAKARQEALKQEIAALDGDMTAINRALIETSKRGQELEEQISGIETEMAGLEATKRDIQKSLRSKSGLLSEVLGALQRMGRKPPPAILVTPQDAIASVRSAIVLGAVVPQIRSESDSLLVELQALVATTQKIEDRRSALAVSLNSLAEDETRLTLLIDEKNQLINRSRADLEEERKKADELIAKATSLQDLIDRLESNIASAAEAAKAAREADKRREEREAERLEAARKGLVSGETGQNALQSGAFGPIGDLTRIEPAVAFSKTKGLLPRPASGELLHRFGEKSAVGTPQYNIALATRPNARVRIPADGWVVYAGPFRSYGQVLILNAGDGYHLVLSGLSQINVAAGQFVLAGEPIGRMGATRVASAAVTELGSNKPVLYVEFRKDGKPFDPSPWWSMRSDKGPDNDS